jgi:uncharacterized membrane protein YidH (DUF202 family)
MGGWLSRGKRDHFKSPSELQEELEQIDVKMAELEAREASLERSRRRLVLLLLIVALVIIAVHSLRWYWLYYPPLIDTLAAYGTLALPAVLCIVLCVLRVINTLF